MKLIVIKFFTILFMLAIFAYIIAFAWVNYSMENIVFINIPIFASEAVKTTISSIILLTAVLSGCAGFLYSIKINAQCDNAIEYYKNKIAQANINNDDNSALVENLQRKISSLEIALEQALNNK